MQNVYGGNEGVVVIDGFIRSRKLYFGVDGEHGFLPEIKCSETENRTGESSAPIHYFDTDAIQTLENQAEQLSKQGISVASTIFSQPDTETELDKIKGHVENLYLQNIVGLNAMKEGDTRVIGDRNWCTLGTGEGTYLVIETINKDEELVFALTVAEINRKVDNQQLKIDDNTSIYYGERGQIRVYNQQNGQ
jgi:hypothetical protein